MTDTNSGITNTQRCNDHWGHLQYNEPGFSPMKQGSNPPQPLCSTIEDCVKRLDEGGSNSDV